MNIKIEKLLNQFCTVCSLVRFSDCSFVIVMQFVIFCSGNYLVRVRAQVMSRDDSSGGWVPLGGGGLSNVSVRKKPRPSPSSAPGTDPLTKPKHDYLIYGKRISDQSVRNCFFFLLQKIDKTVTVHYNFSLK